jgi:methionyl-tRNA formyltransferase
VQIAVAATPEVALPTLEALLKSEHDLVSVITQPDRPAGRGLSLKESPVAIWAKDRGISVSKPIDQEELKLAVADIDLVITIGFGVIIKEEIFNLPTHGFINLHFSLLPKWRGAAPVQRAIEAGDEVTGVTVFKLDKGMDTGPIYRQKEIAMPHQATTDSLLQNLAVVGAPVVLDAISAIEANELPVNQSVDGASRADKLSKDEARIDWRDASFKIERKIRAFYPAPGAWTTFRDEAIKIESADVTDEKTGQPGEILLVGKEMFVSTPEGSLQILRVKPAGKASMDAISWINGARIEQHERFI